MRSPRHTAVSRRGSRRAASPCPRPSRTEAPVSPLRRRMIEDMTIRKFAPRTQEGYIRAVKSFSAFLGASPDGASFEDLRRYQLHLVSSGVGVPTINHTLTALRFLFLVTLRKPDVVIHVPFVRE